MRGLPPLCLAVALVGCSGGVALGQGEPEPAPTEPAPNAKPDPLAELVLQRRRRVGAPGVPSLPNPVRSFARDDEKSDTAYFVRLVGAKIGGEFDAAGDEEVQFDVLVGRESRKLYREVLDLPSGALGDFAFDGEKLGD